MYFLFDALCMVFKIQLLSKARDCPEQFLVAQGISVPCPSFLEQGQQFPQFPFLELSVPGWPGQEQEPQAVGRAVTPGRDPPEMPPCATQGSLTEHTDKPLVVQNTPIFPLKTHNMQVYFLQLFQAGYPNCWQTARMRLPWILCTDSHEIHPCIIPRVVRAFHS